MNLDQHLYEWIRVANEHKERYGFFPGLIESRVYELKERLGETYLLGIFESDDPLHILGLRGQELDRWLRGGAYVDQHVIQLIEFASYLQHFNEDNCLESKILKLKTDSFPPTFFELAMAFRMRQAVGTSGAVSLSCEAEDAVGDFITDLNEKKIVCECSRLEFGEGEEEQYRLAGDLYLYIDKKIKKLKVPICLKIRIHNPLTGVVFNAATQILRQLFAKFEQDLTPKTLEGMGLSVSIEPLTTDSERIPFRYKDERVVDVLDTDWVTAQSLCYVPARDDREVADKYRRGEDLAEQEYARIFVKFPRNTAEFDPYARIGNKIKKKISQTDIAERYLGRIVFLESPWDITIMDHPRLNSIIGERLRNSSKTIAVVLCQRRLNTHYRHWYLHFGPATGSAFAHNVEIQDCLTRLVTYDRDFDPILNERYTRSWKEALALAEQHRHGWQRLQEKREQKL